jgi:hypothetical protein
MVSVRNQSDSHFRRAALERDLREAFKGIPMKKTDVFSTKRALHRASLLLAIVIAGCAGASVAPQVQSGPASASRPTTIYVYDFAVTTTEVTLNQGFFQKTYSNMTDQNVEQAQVALADQTAQALSYQLVAELQAMGFYAIRLPRGTPASGSNILVVDGQFTDIDQGNKLRRMVIGLGMGQSKLDASVQVYQVVDGSSTQILDFNTHADSGSMPGAAIMGAPGAAVGGAAMVASVGVNVAAGGVKNYTSATGIMAKRSADQAANFMSQYFAQQGWISAADVQKAKLAYPPS